MRILILADHYEPCICGGAEISLDTIVKSILDLRKDISFNIASPDTKDHQSKNFKVKKLFKWFNSPDLFNNIWPLNDLLLFISYLKEIKAFRPNIIISQLYSIFPAIFAGKIANIPVVAIIRDITPACPNKMAITFNGEACKSLFRFGTCLKCFSKWKSTIDPFEKENEANLFQYFKKFFFILQNIVRTAYGISILKKTKYKWVASTLFKQIYESKIGETVVAPIIPIKMAKDVLKLVDHSTINPELLETKKIKLIMSVPSIGGIHKGLKFMLEEVMPQLGNRAILYIAGNDRLGSGDFYVSLGKLTHHEFINQLKYCDVVIVPSIWYEAFGRIAIEGLFQGKQVIISDRVGVGTEFENIKGVWKLKLDPKLWVKTILNIEKIKDTNDKLKISKIIENFSPDVVSLKFISQIENIIKDKNINNP